MNEAYELASGESDRKFDHYEVWTPTGGLDQGTEEKKRSVHVLEDAMEYYLEQEGSILAGLMV